MRLIPRVVMCTILLLGLASPTFAKTRPIEQLPSDVLRWSTLWMEVPRQISAVHHEEGPLASVTWGPAKGAAMMVRSTAAELWTTLKDERRDPRSSRPMGPLVCYEF